MVLGETECYCLGGGGGGGGGDSVSTKHAYTRLIGMV